MKRNKLAFPQLSPMLGGIEDKNATLKSILNQCIKAGKCHMLLRVCDKQSQRHEVSRITIRMLK